MGYLYALIAALLFGANGSVAKVIIEAGISPVQLTQFRVAGVTVLAAALLAVLNRKAFRISWRQLRVMVILGVLGVALLQAFYAVAIQLLPVGVALLIEYTAVLFVAVIAFVFLKEQVKHRLWIAIGCVLIGLAIVARIWDSSLNPLGVLAAFGAAAALTVYFIVGERQVMATSALVVAFWTMATATVFWAPLSGWWRIAPETLVTPVSLSGNLSDLLVPLWVPITYTVVLGSFAPFMFSLLALRYLTATAAGVVATSEVIFAFIVAWLWLNEGLSAVQVVGAAIVLVGIVLAQTSRKTGPVDADLALPPRSITLP